MQGSYQQTSSILAVEQMKRVFSRHLSVSWNTQTSMLLSSTCLLASPDVTKLQKLLSRRVLRLKHCRHYIFASPALTLNRLSNSSLQSKSLPFRHSSHASKQ